MKLEDYGQVTIILRGLDYETVRVICQVIEQSKCIKNVEITLNTPDVFSTIQKISSEFKGKLHIGAGTVTNLNEAIHAVEHGAEFILSPIVLDDAVISYAKSQNVLTISGAFTPSEIHVAYERGCDIVKVFPATSVSENYFKDVKAPLGDIPLMAVGGVNRENGKAFLTHGVNYLGLGARGIFSQEALYKKDLFSLKKECELFEQKVLSC